MNGWMLDKTLSMSLSLYEDELAQVLGFSYYFNTKWAESLCFLLFQQNSFSFQKSSWHKLEESIEEVQILRQILKIYLHVNSIRRRTLLFTPISLAFRNQCSVNICWKTTFYPFKMPLEPSLCLLLAARETHPFLLIQTLHWPRRPPPLLSPHLLRS